jgi:hypothetical protein
MTLRMGGKDTPNTLVQNGPYFFNRRKSSSFFLVSADHLERVRGSARCIGRRRHLRGGGGGGGDEAAAAETVARRTEERGQ